MAKERWSGRFIVEYDDVDLENLLYKSAQERRSLRHALEADAKERARKASEFLRMKTISLNGDRSARVIFTTEAADQKA